MSEPSDRLFDVVHRQRACRAFDSDRDLDDATIERVLDAATFAPSAENGQPWVFVVVRDPAARARLGELTRMAWEGGARAYEQERLPPAMFADVDQGAAGGGVSGAPVLIVVCGDSRRGHESTLPSSTFPAIQNLLLAATALGLGSALTTLPTAFGAELRELLALPDPVKAMAVVPLGWPARPLGPPRREPVAEHAHRERYGAGW